jgi:hypothetical protein
MAAAVACALAGAVSTAVAAPPPVGCSARCAGVASGVPTARSLAPSPRLRVRFAARLVGIRSATLASLEANALTVRAERRRIVLERDGRRVRRGALHAPRRGWTTIVLTLDARRGLVRLRADRRRRSFRLRGLRAERRVVIGDCARPRGVRIRRIAITARGSRRVRPVRAPACPGDRAPSRPAPVAPTPAPPAGPPAEAPSRLFAADSFWNRPLPAGAPIDPRSAAYVADLRRQLALANPWINTTQYSTPVYRVPAGQPTERVVLDANLPALQREWEAVPIPTTATPAAGTDRHLVVHQPSTDAMWEFWHLERRAGVWHAGWGGKMSGVSASRGYFSGAQANWGATATSLPLPGGLMTIDELRRGRIDHALAIGIPQPKAGVFSWPAQRTDGTSTAANAIPAGVRFRLDPSLDLATLSLPWLVRLMAEAAQRYGVVVRDTAGAVTFYGEDPTPTGTDPWRAAGGFFGGQLPSTLLARFPWDRLQALQTQLSG